jgi:hypothetical protein
VVAVFVREVRGMLLGDWARVQGDIRLMAGVPPSFFLHFGYMGFAPDNLPDPDAMRLRACIHATPHMQARHPKGQHMHMHQHLGKP